MSDRKPRRRDRLIKQFRRHKSPAEKKTVSSAVACQNEITTPPATTPTPSTQQAEPPRGVIGDATFKSNPTGQPGPTSATAAHIQVTVADSTQAQSLWSMAINSDELSSQRKTLENTGFGADSQETASAVKSTMDEILSKRKGEQWKVKFRGEDVVLRDVGTKILQWVDKFKQVGDTIVQYDPAHAALPWAGFRFLLQVGLNR